MGIKSGAATFKHYRIPRLSLEPESTKHKTFWESVNYRKFVPIPPESIDTRRAGWCSLGNPYEVDFKKEEVFFGWGYMLGMRIDTYRIPATLIKDRVKKKTNEFLLENYPEKDPATVRIEKETIREWKSEISTLLRISGEILPSTSYCDVVLDFRQGSAFLFSHSRAADELFFSLFGYTFPDTSLEDSGYLRVADDVIELVKKDSERVSDLIEHLKALGRPEALSHD